MSLSTIHVPSEGNRNAKILIVGEAPGADEEEAGRPFVGKSGQFLERYLGRAGITREDVYLTNLCRYRPKGNRFEYCLDSSQLRDGLDAVKAEIEEIKPNVIVACGAWPMYFLTGCKSDKKNAEAGSGISQWRGSVVPSILVEGRKVAITHHPAYIIRPQGYENHPIFLRDIRRAVEESKYPELRPPVYDEIIDPVDNLGVLVDELCAAEYVTVDIETFGDELACVGFTDSTARGVCLTFKNKFENWEASEAILRSPAKKIFQYGAFDINYLQWYYGWRTENYAFDTYVAANNILPGFPKKLDFLASIYTRFNYWKEERKTWRTWRTSMKLDQLWSYNLKDVVATHTIAMEQMKILKWNA